jgi:hypothetical protein
MKRLTQENIVVGVIILALVGVIVVSLGYGPRARLVPVPVAVFGLILALIQLVWQNVRSTDELQVDLLEVLTKSGERGRTSPPAPVEAAAHPAPAPKSESGWRKELVAYAMVLAFLALVLALGPIAAIFLFTAGYFIASGRYRWPKALVYGALFTSGVYLLFVVALETQLYHGLLEPLVERFR